jgi:hypothetical protein
VLERGDMANNAQKIPFPSQLKLSGNIAVEWKRFIGQWRNYEVATDLAAEAARKRTAIFLACAGGEAQELFQTMDLAETART